MKEQHREISLGPGEGRTMSTMGVKLTFKAVSEDTGGAYALFEYSAPPGFGGPPLHIHKSIDEAFYVLEGELTFQIGDHTARATAGSFVQVPAGSVHTFSNPGTTPTKFLGLLSPGGFEKYLEELPEIVAKYGFPPPPDILSDIGKKYDVEYVDLLRGN